MKCDTIPELERFLAIQEKAMGANSPEVASTLRKLADLYFERRDFEKAEPIYRKAIDILEHQSGFHRAGLEEVQNRLNQMLEVKQGINPATQSSVSHTAIADNTVKERKSEGGTIPLAQRQSVTDSSSSLPATTLAPSAGAPNKNTRSAKAVNDAIHDTELEIELLKQMVGPENTAVADLLTKLADLYCRVRMYSKMEPVLVDALKIREQACGSEHASVSTELKNLATLYCVQERYALAEPLLKRAIAIREKAYGRQHPRVADIEAQYAHLLRRTNRVHQAEAIESHINEIRAQYDSASHPRKGTFFGVL